MPSATLGVSLIEILISFTLLSLMLLGLDIMQIASLREVRRVYYGAFAHQQLKNMAEYLVMLKGNSSNHYLTQWNQQNYDQLPHAKGIVKGTLPSYSISIFWGQYKPFACENKLGETGCLNLKINLKEFF